MTAGTSDLRRAVGGIAGLLFAVGALAAFATAGSAAAGDGGSIAALVDAIRRNHHLLVAVQQASASLNYVRGAGAVFGIGLGVALGSVVAFVRRSH
ncbi:MAG: hypothetical protein ABEK02_01905 [Haloquadratum sp.]